MRRSREPLPSPALFPQPPGYQVPLPGWKKLPTEHICSPHPTPTPAPQVLGPKTASLIPAYLLGESSDHWHLTSTRVGCLQASTLISYKKFDSTLGKSLPPPGLSVCICQMEKCVTFSLDCHLPDGWREAGQAC